MATPQFLYDDPGSNTKDSRPCFNASGTKVVFMREVAGASSLWTVEVATGALTQLIPDNPVKGVNEATRPDWSWHDHRIAFSGSREISGAQKHGLFIVDANGTNLQHVPVSVNSNHIAGTDISYPSWYPGGTHIAVTDYGKNRILKVAISSGHADRLTDPAAILTGQSSVNQHSSDLICAAAQPPTTAGYDQMKNHVWVQAATGAPYSIQVAGHGHGRAPWWSPDGQRIAYESDHNTTNDQYAIYIYHRSDQRITPVTPRYGWDCAHAKFHPTIPNMIVVGAHKTGDRGGIAIVDFDATV